ncbi:MAG: RNA methyltransferase [Crocinitomicaceae bacterium]|nr:RNA methyltransferase [Crocinitomicaceae bacterium]
MPLTNSEIKFVKSLHLKKNRQENDLYLVEGEKMIQELLVQDRFETSELFGLEEIQDADVQIVSKKELERMSSLKNPNKFLAVVSTKPKVKEQEFDKALMVDLVNDPGNLGTIIRTADWFGITKIFLDQNSVDVFNPKVVQSTMGAIFRVEVEYCDLLMKTNELKNQGFKFYGAFMDGDDYNAIDFNEKSVLVMGSESHGISDGLGKLLDQKITIPRQGKSESLNLAVATGILLSKFSA